MSTKTNPFAPFAGMDPSQFDFSKLLGGFELPGVDMEALMASQKKNLDALTQANRVAAAGLQAIAKRQSEILGETMAALTAASQRMGRAAAPGDLAAQQAAAAKEAFEKALADMRQLAELWAKSTDEVIGVVGARVAEGLDEAKGLASRKK